MNIKNFSPSRLKGPLFLILVLILLLITGVVFFKTQITVNPELKNINIDSSADILLNKFKQTSRTNGIKEWALKAASAKIINDKNLALLKDVSATIFTEDDTQINITAEDGELNTKTHDIKLFGNATIFYEGILLETDTLHYRKKSHIVYSNDKVRIKKQNSSIQADSLVADLRNSTLELKGNIKGNFFETTSF